MQHKTDGFDLASAKVCVVMNRGSGKKKHVELREMLNERLAPACGSFELRMVEGCMTCGSCGHSKCS